MKTIDSIGKEKWPLCHVRIWTEFLLSLMPTWPLCWCELETKQIQQPNKTEIRLFFNRVAQRESHPHATQETQVRSLGQGKPLWCSCLENPMGRGAWWATVYGAAKSLVRQSKHAHSKHALYLWPPYLGMRALNQTQGAHSAPCQMTVFCQSYTRLLSLFLWLLLPLYL